MQDERKDVYTTGALVKLFAQHTTSSRTETFAEHAVRMFIIDELFGILLHLHPELTEQHTAVVHTALTTWDTYQREIWGLLSHPCQSRVKQAYPGSLEHLEVGTTGQPGPYMRMVHEWLEECEEYDSDAIESGCDDDGDSDETDSVADEEPYDGDTEEPPSPRHGWPLKRARDDEEDDDDDDAEERVRSAKRVRT